jgi:CubicO group peptidase (beta-lactamase class C family)
MRKTSILVVLGFLTRLLGAQTPADADIRTILADRIDAQKQGVGIVVGVIDDKGRRVIAHGPLANGAKAEVDGDTLFEIGSATKVFTALLLADMVQKGEVALTDPVAKYLPAGTKMPERGGKAITLEHLATHTSGLPRLPSNLAPKDPGNPYADYTPTELYAFLSTYELTRDPGARYEYSNLGAGLLAHVLALRAGTDLETLYRKRIWDPLGMKSTSIRIPAAMQVRLAKGHDQMLRPAGNWDFSALAGAGAIRSTANDMLTFLAAAMGLKKTPLSKAMASMTATRRKTDMPGVDIALGWHVSNVNGHDIIWHNGGTGGYRSFAGFDPKRRAGVVVLSNAFTPAGVDDIGLHLLDERSKLLTPPTQRKEIALDAKILDRYVGRYQLAPQFVLTVTREGSQLFVQATGQGRLEVFAEGERDFFYKVVDAQLTFETDKDGRATRVILHQNGRDVPGARVEGEVAEPQTVKIAADVLETYPGRYELAPTFVLTVTREGDRLFAQATGQPRLEVFPKAEREFFYKVVDAQISFIAGSDGKIASLVLHQNGRDMPARKIE